MKTEIDSFDDLLRAARSHRERQRLLFVFAGPAPPETGALVPLMCVDKRPEELASFDALLHESRQFEPPGQPWCLVFAAALAGSPTEAPSDEDADRVLRRMVEAVKTGAFSAYLPFNREGRPVRLGS